MSPNGIRGVDCAAPATATLPTRTRATSAAPLNNGVSDLMCVSYACSVQPRARLPRGLLLGEGEARGEAEEDEDERDDASAARRIEIGRAHV